LASAAGEAEESLLKNSRSRVLTERFGPLLDVSPLATESFRYVQASSAIGVNGVASNPRLLIVRKGANRRPQ
jgi:hypothetical protein